MKKRLAAKHRKKTKTRSVDLQLEEFDKRDLGDDIRRSGTGSVVRQPTPKPTSILLDEDLVERLRQAGAKRGLGYQTMLKMIVREHLDEY
jgi:uncharacterized protein (DUF4415 family)